MHLSRFYRLACVLCPALVLGMSGVCDAEPDDKTLIKLADSGSTKLQQMEREHSEAKNDPNNRDYARALQQDINEEKRRCQEYKSAIRALAPKVKKSGKIDMRDEKGRTLVMLAAALGNDTVTAMVLRENPDLSLFDKSNKIAMDYEQGSGGSAIGNTLKPLWEKAIISGDAERIRHLINCGANTDWIVDGQPPLAISILTGNSTVTDILITNGAHAGNRLSNGGTLVQLAVEHNNANALEALLSQLKETSITFTDGAPIFFHLLTEEKSACLNAWFTQALALGKSETEEGTSYFCLAMRMADTTSAKKLAAAHSKLISVEDKDGNLPLHEAARCGDQELLLELVRLGADIAQKNGRGETVLMHAALSGNTELLNTVLSKITPELLNATDKDGHSAHYYAKLAKDKAAAEALTRAGLHAQKKD